MRRAAGRFQPLALFVAALLFGGAFALQLLLRARLAGQLLSRDAALSFSFGAEAACFLAAGFVVSFLRRGFSWRELGLAALALAIGGFAFLKATGQVSLNYFADRLPADTSELILWAGLSGVAAWLLGLWGASAGVLLGAEGRADLSFAYEGEIARTHLRLNRRTAFLLAGFGLVPPGLLFAAGLYSTALSRLWARLFGGEAIAETHRIAPVEHAVAAAAVAAALLLAGRWVVARAQLARLAPGQRRRRPATVVMTAISIAGVAVGVWALTVVLSVMSGFESDLKRKILGTNAHGLLLKYSSEFSEWRSTEEKVMAVPGVTGATPFIMNEVMIALNQSLTGSELKGIEPSTIERVSDLPRQVIAGELSWLDDPTRIPYIPPKQLKPEASKLLGSQELGDYERDVPERKTNHPDERITGGATEEALRKMPGICIGKEMSHQLRAWIGDVVNVISPIGGDLGPSGPQPRSRGFRVGCIFYSGMYEYDSKFAYISIPEAQKFFRLGGSVTGLELKFHDVDAAHVEGYRVVEAVGGFPYRFKDWGELNRNLFSALKLEKLAMAIILTFIVLVACFNILSTLIMLVLEKTKEISILKSMGARNASVMKIFVVEGLTIGALGTAMGLLLGLASCSFIERYGLRLDPDVYYISNLPVNVDGLQFVMVAAISLALSYLATLYPAVKASRLSPVDGLRED